MLLKAENISKLYYSDQDVLICRALDDVSLSIAEGERITITGPSGSGKSTLLNILGGIDFPDSGQVLFKDEKLNEMNAKQQAEYRNIHAGFIFQDHYLIKHCTVLENVLLPSLAFTKKTTKEKQDEAENILETLGIIDKKNYLPSMLSGGERQRAAFARALINSPDFILADEPTGNLDQKNSEQAMNFLLSYTQNEKKTLVVVTHAAHIASMFNTEYSMIDGKINKVRG